jgi:hypothetical protein
MRLAGGSAFPAARARTEQKRHERATGVRAPSYDFEIASRWSANSSGWL